MTTLPSTLAKLVPTGIHSIGGTDYMHDTKGRLTPLTLIRPQDKLRDEMVRHEIAYAKALGAELARFKSRAFGQAEDFMALLAQEYGLRDPAGAKGNKTFTSIDGLFKIEIQISDRISFGSELQIAKALIDNCIRTWGAGADERIRALVQYAFEVDKVGRISPTRIALLRRANINDPQWLEAMRAIDEAKDVVSSAEYIRFYERSVPTDKWSPITLDLASAEMTAEAAALGGLSTAIANYEREMEKLREENALLRGDE